MQTSDTQKRAGLWSYLFWGLVLGLTALVALRHLLPPETSLFPPSDGAPFYPFDYQKAMWKSFYGFGTNAFYPARLLSVLLPPLVYHTAGYVVDTVLLCLAGLYFLKGRGLRGVSAWIPAIALGFSGYAFTLISAGHRGIFDMMPFAVFVFGFLDRAIVRRSLFHFAWAGACFAFAAAAQPDITVLFALLIAAYGAFRWVSEWMTTREGRLRLLTRTTAGVILATVVVVALSMSSFKALFGRAVETRQAQLAQAAGAGVDEFIFVTNWSMPPEEILEFFAPCVFGIETRDPAGPYWGRLGRAHGWQPGQQGLTNLKQHTLYMGVLQFMFAAYALAVVLRRRSTPDSSSESTPNNQHPTPNVQQSIPNNQHPTPNLPREKHFLGRWVLSVGCWMFNSVPPKTLTKRGTSEAGLEPDTGPVFGRSDVLFWSVALVVTVLLALGRYTPFYKLFYHLPLPYVSKIRAPVKFIHLAELALCALFAFGLAAFFRDVKALRGDRDEAVKTSVKRRLTSFAVAGGVLGIAFLLTAMIATASETSLTAYWQELGLAQFSDKMMSCMAGGLVHGAVLFLVGAGMFLAARMHHESKMIVPALTAVVVLAVPLDLAITGGRYVRVGDVRPWYQSNPVADIIKAEKQPARLSYHVAPRTWRNWVTGNFYQHGVEMLEPKSAPTDAYGEFMQALAKHPLRLWQVGGATFVAGPVKGVEALIQNPGFDVVQYFNAVNGRISLVKGPNAPFVLLRYKRAFPRAMVFYAWEKVTAEEALTRLADPDWNPGKKALVSDGMESADWGVVPTVATVKKRTRTRVEVDVKARASGLLLLNDRYNPDWCVNVDGKREELVRCNYVMRGVAVPPGNHTVVFTRRPYIVPFVFTLLVSLALVAWALARVAGSFRRSKSAE